ncbi:MAG: citramalate synthase [Rhodospirillales bacterium]|nr:citramalate synthase [Rhodospirillales bacterium]
MQNDRVYLFDSTLRDGAQAQGVDFSAADKRAIAQALDALGLDYIEGGWPGANPTDDAFFDALPPTRRGRIVAFGMTRRPGRSPENDPGLSAVLNAAAPVACLVGKTWDFHVDLALQTSLEENLAMIGDSLALAVRRKQEAQFDAEHFFDGFKADRDYALACLRCAAEAGAAWVTLCDTNGGTLPGEIRQIVAEVAAALPKVRLGIHCHNDTENAVANSLTAVEVGARLVQGTVNGLGERCGNANLISLIPSLVLKTAFETGIQEEGLRQLTGVSNLLDERLNRSPAAGRAYVGANAFAHKGGLHVSAVAKDPRSYEHIDPGLVGNRRHIVVSDQAGRANILARLEELGIDPQSLGKPKLAGRLVAEVKAKEYQGYAFDGAPASFELLARRLLGEVPSYFALQRFRVTDDRRLNAKGVLVTESEATVTLEVAGRASMTVATGNGPVNALDLALRKALLPQYGILADMRLTDYKVRILTPEAGTEAVTRVMIESADGEGQHWVTVGVSPNIIDASFIALSDAIHWKLYRHGA